MECGHSQGLPEIFWLPPIVPGTGKAADFFKFGRDIHRVNPNKSQLEILQKRSVGVSGDCPIFWIPLLSQKRVKLCRDCRPASNFERMGRSEQKSEKMGKVAASVVRKSRKLSGHPYALYIGVSRGHLCDSTAYLYQSYAPVKDRVLRCSGKCFKCSRCFGLWTNLPQTRSLGSGPVPHCHWGGAPDAIAYPPP